MYNHEQDCAPFEHPSHFASFVAISLAIGIFFSYLPQHIRIIKRRTSEGISPWFLLLGVTSGTCAFLNILMLSGGIINCCKVIAGGDCFAATLGIIQIGIQTVSAALILVFCLIYTRNQLLEPHDEYVKIVTTGQICLAHAIIASLVAFIVVVWYPEYIIFTADLLGIIGTILAIVQYLPQIHTTAKLRHAGSLSIPMMWIQTPGGFAWAASLAMREGTKWSSWFPYFTAACLQGVVLSMCVYFEWVKPKTESITTNPRVVNEQTPLL